LSQLTRNPAPIVLKPIATVRNDVKELGRHDSEHVVSEIVFKPNLVDALDGVEEFSHIQVLFWMHLSPPGESAPPKTHPQMRQDLPLVGVLATRSPVRPNPLGLAVVKLLERKGNVLKVSGLDAIDGTPVVDIKPYLPGDSITQIRVPDWFHKLHQSKSKKAIKHPRSHG